MKNFLRTCTPSLKTIGLVAVGFAAGVALVAWALPEEALDVIDHVG